jgi:mannan endo-1,4-beta-mannosidase
MKTHFMKQQGLLFFALVCLTLSSCKLWEKEPDTSKVDFVSVNNTGFEINGAPYYYMGTNFWYGLNLGDKRDGGDRERLIRELDRLKALGVNNLRIMGGSEGPDTEPYRMVPSLQFKPRMYNREVFDGLDFLLAEMKKRKMYAVVCLNNFWNWSGGMAQYLVWAGAADSIPYPPPHPGGDWGKFQLFSAQFYSNQKAVDLFNDHIEFIVNRRNSISGELYKDDPTIMAWELANEPRGGNNVEAFLKWIDNTAGLIKKFDTNHLVTTGSEGKTSSPESGTDLAKDHASKNIDYTTIHIWVQNWNIYDPARAAETYDSAVQYAVAYIDDQERIARNINKPMVLEEFGISRDLNSHVPGTPVTIRDKYYARIFEEVYNRSKRDSSVVAGVNFWAWAGEGRPREPAGLWKPLDDFIGDPPHEPQGWYSVYDNDSTTIAIIKEYAEKMSNIARK